MGYQRKDLQILGGSFNLGAPPDKTPKTDYLLAQNWRVDRDGKLMSRYGYPLKFQLFGPQYAHTAVLYGGVEGDYYVGANGGGTNPGHVYWKDQGSIVAGLTGSRVGMVPMNGWMWIMDPNVQGKHNGAQGFQNWGIVPPGNALGASPGADNAAGPSGTYQFFVTFATSDQSVESNPGPESDPVTLTEQDVLLTSIPVSGDPQVGARNIYAVGGTLGQAYQIGQINDNVTRDAVFNLTDTIPGSSTAILPEWNDLSATDAGIVMPTTNDLPPAASGMVGPHFSRLFAWRVNRLFYTDPDVPQYWPGASGVIESESNWVDVGVDGEAIIWCTIHGNVLTIYKERSIWQLIGDPDSGYLERYVDGIGLVSPFAVAEAGSADYFVSPNGIYYNTGGAINDMTEPLRPLFQQQSTNSGPLTQPGSILPGPQFLTNSLNCYSTALGFAMGKLYVAYSEQSSSAGAMLLVYDEAKQRWAYHRNQAGGGGLLPFQGFYFDGVWLMGLTGNGANEALAFSLDDFLSDYTGDYGNEPIECVYQSHYEDAGEPDNQKNWLEVVIDYEFAGDTATVYAGYDAGNTALASLGTITGTKRQQTSFALGDDGVLAKNISIAIDVSASARVILHNVYLYYYVEARLGLTASTIPLDLGSALVKQCKELQLDIDASNGAVGVNVYSDLPGNQLAVRQTPAVAKNGGRAVMKYPFATTEGFLWRVALTAAADFRLYAARLLMRVIGTYVEAYEAANGFVWDSQELTFDSGITHIPKAYAIAVAALPIKRAREITLQIDTFNGYVSVALLSDLPGNAQAIRFLGSVNTGTVGRRFVRLPLPAGTEPPIEGRMFRLQISGAAKFILYEAAVEILPVGVYVEAYEAAEGAVWDSREQDLGTPEWKEARELELDIETTGAVSAALLTDGVAPGPFSVTTIGRQKVMLPLTFSAPGSQFVEGRLARLIVSGSNAFRLYGARILGRAFGCYLSAAEASGGALWDSTELDLGTQTVKQLREVELEIAAAGTCTVTVYTDLPGNAMTPRATQTVLATPGRIKVQIPLPQGGVPDNYVFGRLARVTVTSSSSFKLFGARIHARAIGVYVEGYEAKAGAVWDSLPRDLGSPAAKEFDQVRVEMDSDGAVQLAVYTDLPGETFSQRTSGMLTTSATSRHWANLALASTGAQPWSIEGRGIRLVATSPAGFRVYQAQVRRAAIGRYIAAAAPGGADSLNTLEWDFGGERIRAVKRIEIDMRADGAVQASLYTNQTTGAMAQEWTRSLTTSGRQTLVLPLTPGIRGRLLRVALASSSAARVYRVRLWTRPLNEPAGAWKWEEYPVEESAVLPEWADIPVPETGEFAWADLPVKPTPPEWQWAPFPVAPTAEWFWAKVLSVDETEDKWQWVDLPFNVS